MILTAQINFYPCGCDHPHTKKVLLLGRLALLHGEQEAFLLFSLLPGPQHRQEHACVCVCVVALPLLPGLLGWTCMATLASSGRVAPHYSRPSVQARGASLWCGVVWCGVVWCGVVWCGVVWCGVVWCAEGAVTKGQKAGMSTHG